MMKLLITIIAFVLCAGILVMEWYHLYRNKQKEKTKISFKEGLDLTELPIVTFYQNGKKLHFLLDTGSNISYINKEVLNSIEAEDLNALSNTFGVEGNGVETHHYMIEVGYKNQKFKEEFGCLRCAELLEKFDGKGNCNTFIGYCAEEMEKVLK